MILALPLTETSEFSAHFGAASHVGLIEVDETKKTILKVWAEQPLSPEPCSWVDWLAGKGVSYFLAGGMGRGAQQRMAEAGISVIVGVPMATPQELVEAWLSGALTGGINACEGGHHGHGEHHHHGNSNHSGGCHCSH